MNRSVANVKMYKRRLDRWKFSEAILQPWEIYSVYYGSPFSETFGENHYSSYPGQSWKLGSLWSRRIDSVIKFSSRSV